MEKNKEVENTIKKEIPNDIKVAFGKFYTYSIGIILLMLFVMLFINKLSMWFLISFIIIILGFYGFVIFNLFKQKKKFMSSFLILDIIVFALVYSFLVLKIIGLS